MLRDFETVRKYWPPHGQSNMPGKSILVYGLRRISRSPSIIPWLVIVTASLAATVVLTDLLGVNRGEVVRLWIFLACVGQLAAAYVCARLNSQVAIGIALAVTLLHDALGTSMIGFIIPG